MRKLSWPVRCECGSLYRVRRTQAEPGSPAAACGGFRLAFGVVDERSVFLAPRVPLRYALSRHPWPAAAERDAETIRYPLRKQYLYPQMRGSSSLFPGTKAHSVRACKFALHRLQLLSFGSKKAPMALYLRRKALSLWTGRGPFLFPREREMGGVSPPHGEAMHI